MKPRWAFLGAVALSLALPACALIDNNDGDDLEPDVYEGVYAQGFEDSTFEPCGREEVWLITAGNDAAMQDFADRVVAVLNTEGGNPMYARLRGTTSAKGTVPGIFITYDRTLALTEVLDVKPLSEQSCP